MHVYAADDDPAYRHLAETREAMGGGGPFTKRFRTTPTIPAKRVRRRTVHIHQLSPESFTRILRHLNIADMHACRVAELVPRSSAAWPMVREDFCARVRELQEVRAILRRKVPDTTPLEFARASQLTLVLPFGGTLPTGIQHMIALRTLDISSRQGRTIDHVPKVLAQCRQISKLRMRRQMFKQFPECVLQLSKLTSLDVAKCSRLASIPENVGSRLPRLRSLNIIGCTEITTLPTSLLHTLNKWCWPGGTGRDPLICTPTNFAKGYLREVIDSKKYPSLVRRCMHLLEENEQERDEEEDGSGSDEQIDIDVNAL